MPSRRKELSLEFKEPNTYLYKQNNDYQKKTKKTSILNLSKNAVSKTEKLEMIRLIIKLILRVVQI